MPLARRLVELAGQDLRVDHHAVADRAQLAGVEDPGRDQVELPLLAVADDRVAGVVAALEADHEVRVLGEQVDDLALALVAPLGAHDHDAGHAVSAVYEADRAARPPWRLAVAGRRSSARRGSGQLEVARGVGRRRSIGSGSPHISYSRETVRSPICSRSVAPAVEVRGEHDRAAVLVARVDDRVELLEHPRRGLLGADVVDVQQVDGGTAGRSARSASTAASSSNVSRSRPSRRGSE